LKKFERADRVVRWRAYWVWPPCRIVCQHRLPSEFSGSTHHIHGVKSSDNGHLLNTRLQSFKSLHVQLLLLR